MRRLGVPDSYGHSGPAWEVLKDFGLHADAIAEAIQEFAKEKAE